MKNSAKILFLFLLFAAPLIYSSGLEKKSLNSLLYGLEYGNKGIKISCALTIAEYRYKDAVGLLIKTLKSDTDEEVQLASVLALYNIRTDKAVQILKKVSEEFPEGSVKSTAGILYLDLLRTRSIAVK
jgi:HEAT repeat protein